MLPTWVQWYLRPAGDLTTFTLFPWGAFVFAGAASGALIAAARDARSERTLHVVLACVAAVLVAVGFYTAGRPSIYPLANFWTTSPTWFAIRLGILMLALTALFTIEAGRPFSAAAREQRERATVDAPTRLWREGGQGRHGEAESLALHLRFASLPAVVDAQIAQATTMLKACAPREAAFAAADGDAEQTLWREHATRLWSADGAIVRLSWLPANIDAVLAALKGCATTRDVEIVDRAAIGAGHVRIVGDVEAQARAIETLRASTIVGNIVVVRGSAELASRVDVWGSHGDRQPLFDALKRTLDPNNVLNAGRGPL